MTKTVTPELAAVLKSALKALEAANIAGQSLYASKAANDLRALLAQAA